MRPPHLILVLCGLFAFPLLLTCFSKLSAPYSHNDAASSGSSQPRSGLSSWFSFQSPSTLFRPSAIISLTDDNSTFFLSRPAAFGPLLPAKGMSGQLWVGSGFGDDNARRGGSVSAGAEGELGCSDVPGWGEGNHQVGAHGDTNLAGSSSEPTGAGMTEASGRRASHNTRSTSRTEFELQDIHDPLQQDAPANRPSRHDGTDDYLHHPLPGSESLDSSRPGAVPPPGARISLNRAPQHADIQSLQESAEIAGKIVLLSRGGCGFLEKVKWVQRRGGTALIVGDDTRGGGLVTMYAQGDTSNVTIPSLFTSYTTAHLLSSLIPPDGSPEGKPPKEPKAPTHKQPDKESSRIGYKRKGPKKNKQAKDRAVFTTELPLPEPTSTPRPKSSKDEIRKPSPTDSDTPFQVKESISWFRYILSKVGFGNAPPLRPDLSEDSRRPPSSGQLDWVLLSDWRDEDVVTTASEAASKVRSGQSPKEQIRADRSTPAGLAHKDDFVIGVQDWRDPDLVSPPPKDANKASESTARSSSEIVRGAQPNQAARNSLSRIGANNNRPGHGQSAKNLPGGSITPSSGEYGNLGAAAVEEYQEDSLRGMDDRDEETGSSQTKDKSWFGKLLGSSEHELGDPSLKAGLGGDSASPGEPGSPTLNEAELDFADEDADAPEDEGHEGLWVTLTPTSMSTSPFFDTLLVLVISPLVTLTVVYAMLLLRSRIRRRRWRAPKSVVERLPVRIYHTLSSPSSPGSTRLSTPRSSSPSSPLLQGSSSPPLQSRARSQTASSILEVTETPRSRNRLGRKEVEKSQAAANEWRRRYTGKQVECVVCLEEYVDGVSRVMGLPCGHEFHVDCITPWLTTRRRTCPICKGDVVRSLARSSSSHTHYPAYRDEPGDGIRSRAAETIDDSPSSAIPIPAALTAGESLDPESGYGSGPTESRSVERRSGWRGLRAADFGSLRVLSASFLGRNSRHHAEEERDR